MAAKDDREIEPFFVITDTSQLPLHLLNPSLSDKQLLCIEYVCEFGLGVSKELVASAKDERGKLKFDALYTLLSQQFVDDAPSLLRLLLDRLGYNTPNKAIKNDLLSKLPAVDPNKEKAIYVKYPQFDMSLTLAIGMTSMRDNAYSVLQEHVVRKVLSHSHSIDNIESPCHLLELVNRYQQQPDKVNQQRPDEVNPEPVLDPKDLSNVLMWFKDCGLEYSKEIVQYQRRYDYEIPVPRPKKNCCCLWMIVTLIFLLLSSITFISLVVIFSKIKVIDDNVRLSQNKTYPIIGLSTNIKLECYHTSITDTVIATAITLDNATIYTIPEDEVSTYQQALPYINLNKCMSTNSSIHTLPIPVSYHTCYEPIYTASGGGTLNYSIDLVNSNPDRVSCAMRLFVFSFHSDYISYYNVARDPHVDQSHSIYSSACVGSNGTHSFSIPLPSNSLLYFVLAVVNHTTVTVSVSGNISAYSNTARYRGDECNLTRSDRSCSIVINPKKSRYNSDVGSLCLFVNSTYTHQGKVNLFTTYIKKKRYLKKYWIPSIPVGSFTFISFILLCFVIFYYRYLCKCCKKKKQDCSSI